MTDTLTNKIRKVAIERFAMPITGIHGIGHWDRVHENAVYLAKHSGADLVVVELFAYLHDCCRESDGADPDHGKRAAIFAECLRDSIVPLDADRFELLRFACAFHEKGRISDDPTVGTCWDADRLDLGRVGIRPNPKFLSTNRARYKTVLDWGYRRSRGHKVRMKA